MSPDLCFNYLRYMLKSQQNCWVNPYRLCLKVVEHIQVFQKQFSCIVPYAIAISLMNTTLTSMWAIAITSHSMRVPLGRSLPVSPRVSNKVHLSICQTRLEQMGMSSTNRSIHNIPIHLLPQQVTKVHDRRDFQIVAQLSYAIFRSHT